MARLYGVHRLIGMKPLKNPKLIVGVGMILLGLCLMLAWFVRVPTREISRAEFEQFLQAKDITAGLLIPTPYAGVYRVEGTHRIANKTEKIYITMHLDEARMKSLFEQSALKLE